ncbi:TonB-dependent receptor [Phenylobacterium sp.]|uniref:TonB-dependent receptor n=1 Tax=Phenylobacterium sp. TaxID=1871053 RepID=UPI002BCD6B3D|nr:TonB-dependent receptor [Phenylobacterium sp.]HLZ74861.1 TonB-dependent receptor [Phenylobacterium sp.]
MANGFARKIALLSGVAVLMTAGSAMAGEAAADAGDAGGGATVEPVVVTARLRPEDAQSAPISLSVVSEATLTTTQTYTVSQISQLIPSLNYSSPNPRNTSLTIRGLGSSVLAISQSNDGLEPGVGFYVDQVYHARPASAAFDFQDVERVEVLRGPQGTLFGKNTTAGAINITTQAPSFTAAAQAEVTGGNLNYWQEKASVTGPIWGDVVAGRLSVVATNRDGVIRNVVTGREENNVNDFAYHAQLLIQPASNFSVRLSADDAKIDTICCTQVFVRVGTSLKPAARQFAALAAGVNYAPPSLNPFDRLTDIDAPLKVDTDEGGLSAIANWDLGKATVTSVSAWRWWNWDAANDRDYTGLQIQLLQHIPSRQDQYSQELRIASNGRQTLEYVAGLYAFTQKITGEPITGYGPLATYWLLGPAPAFPANLLNGYTQDGHTRFHSDSLAAFGEATWRVTEAFNLTGGLRYTYEGKDGQYSTFVFGGLPATGSLLNSQLSILRPQTYSAKNTDGSLSGRAQAAYNLTDGVMAYVSYANASKSGGINMSGLPVDPAGNPALATAVVKPEHDTTYEVGVKSKLFGDRLVLNANVFDTTVRDFQTNVVDTGPGALRGYLANIDKVRVKGLEVDANFVVSEHLSGRFGLSRTDGRYISYKNGPCPLELTGSSTTVCDLSGKPLSTLPKFAWSAGAQYHHEVALGTLAGEAYLDGEFTARTRIFGDPTDSRFTVIDGYDLVNATLGFRTDSHWEVALWVHNLFDKNYLQNVTVQSGNSGLIIGTPSDPRTIGLTLRARL